MATMVLCPGNTSETIDWAEVHPKIGEKRLDFEDFFLIFNDHPDSLVESLQSNFHTYPANLQSKCHTYPESLQSNFHSYFVAQFILNWERVEAWNFHWNFQCKLSV